MEPPSKRPRTGPASYDGDDDDDVAEDELSMNPVQFDIEQDPLYELDRGRANAASRLKSRFEDIFAKYEKDFTGIGDEIDFHTGEVVVDNGHIEAILQQEDDDDDHGGDSGSDNDASDTEMDSASDGFVPGMALQDPVSTASDSTKNHWTLPADLPDLDRAEALGPPKNGSFRSDMSTGAYHGTSMASAPPLLNPALLQYDSFGQARMRRSLSDMLSRYSHSRLTNAKSFVQAQKSTTTLGAIHHSSSTRAATIGQRGILSYGVPAYAAKQSHGNEESSRKPSRRPLAEKASANVAKKVKELRKIRNSAKAKKSEAIRARKPKTVPETEGTSNLVADDVVVVKRKRGRPRKVRLPDENETGLPLRVDQTLALKDAAPQKSVKQRQKSAHRKGPEEVEAAPEDGDLPVISDTITVPVKRAYRKSLTSRRRKPVGATKRLATKPTARRKKLRLVSDAQRKSGRARKQTEFYGELISTLEIEQSLLESDDDDNGELRHSLRGLRPSHLQNDVQGTQHGRELSPDLSSQRIIRDSQEPASSWPTVSTFRATSHEVRSPLRAGGLVVRDSQEPSSSIPIPDACSPNIASQPHETFRRNEVDPTYGFSDDEDTDLGVRHPLRASQIRNDCPVPMNEKSISPGPPLPVIAQVRQASAESFGNVNNAIFTSSIFEPSGEALPPAAEGTINVMEDKMPSPSVRTSMTPPPKISPTKGMATESLEHNTPDSGAGEDADASLLGARTRSPRRSSHLSSRCNSPTNTPYDDDTAAAAKINFEPQPITEGNGLVSTERSSSLTATGPEDEPITPKEHRFKEIKVKTSSYVRRRVLALSNLVPDPSAVDGDEDELSTAFPASYRGSSGDPSQLTRSGIADRQRFSTPPGRPSTPDETSKATRRRRSLHANSKPAIHTGSVTAADASESAEAGVPRRRKTGFGFENARGVEPRMSSVTPQVLPCTAAATANRSTGARSKLVTRSKPGLSVPAGSSPSKTTQISPLARRTLTSGGINPAVVTETPSNRKRRRHIGDDGSDQSKPQIREDDDVSHEDGGGSSEGELVQTPGGTMRRCGVGGFTCDRDFCLVCCI
ncbi:uncharacterized protein B0I36DRAFT_413174 [Microdochium trichocladiopsis]|uniref:Centromere protein Scm3-domain-containing protein n=1 Tax=Microdochium trichocladiopsis TaxID=1682393 RepID=A0A9P8Y1W4_9PEZI|nr:uncharacterized protein B0I36DRAFT_413174 [Microdochium trichocladiopsis]KAH7027675.1 hypothetical protein B0I36DRAFT_413174 [Microdochium trichocladiopsis]